MARPRALSREELYDALWPSTFVCETNLASVVNEVRRALGDDARAARYIRTVHGFGYAFCGEVATSRGDSAIVAMLLCGERRYSLRQGENLVGRSPECRVVIDDTTISRRHAVINVHEGTCTVRDRDSMNGTFVDGRPIGRTPVIVTTSSRIVFGSLGASIRFQALSSTDASLKDVTEVKRRMAGRLANR